MDGEEEPRMRGINSGTHFLFCGGRIVIGPDWKSLLGSTILIVTPMVVFCVWVLPWVGPHISWALVGISAAWIAFALAMLGMTALRDPGFIPRSPPDTDVEYGMQPPTKDHQINGYTVTTKYCTTCSHYRPPRCSHCAVCDNCVDKFDHHCPWVGTCIGRRNYRYFFLFVSSTALLCCWVFGLSITNLVLAARDAGWGWGTAAREHPAAIVCAIYTFLGFWFVGGLTALHSYLISSNQTTYEHFRHRYSDLGNPYAKGFAANWGEVFCTSIPPRWGALGLQQRAEAHADTPTAASHSRGGVAVAAATAGATAAAAEEMQYLQMQPVKRNGNHAAHPANGSGHSSMGLGSGPGQAVELQLYAGRGEEEAPGSSSDAGHLGPGGGPPLPHQSLDELDGGELYLQRAGSVGAVSERINTGNSFTPAGSRDSSYHPDAPASHEPGMWSFAGRPAAEGTAGSAGSDVGSLGEDRGVSPLTLPLPQHTQAPHQPAAARLLSGRTRGQTASSSSGNGAGNGDVGGSSGSTGDPAGQLGSQAPVAPQAVPPGAAAVAPDFGLQSPRPSLAR